jgi:hypothetical protein
MDAWYERPGIDFGHDASSHHTMGLFVVVICVCKEALRSECVSKVK